MLRRFLERRGVAVDEVRHWIVHPGGPRVLDAYERSLGLDATALDWTRDVLADCGNLSSATVLVALARFLTSARPGPGERMVLSSVGPGFALETLLLRT
jgi:alkylresorcinol/alkylpyrone synthase